MQGQKNKRKNHKNMTENTNEEEEKYESNTVSANNAVQSSSCCSSEDDSNASHDLNITGSTANLNGKTRASRGAATDPQSLYARVRQSHAYIYMHNPKMLDALRL